MIDITPEQWIVSGDTGISSKTIWAVMMGAVPSEDRTERFQFDVPRDPADFGRCYRLLLVFPEWLGRLDEVSQRFPKWGPFVENWDAMSILYRRELPSGICKELYKLMQELYEDGMIADGWIRTSPAGWRKP
jgi:hypothetical protein